MISDFGFLIIKKEARFWLVLYNSISCTVIPISRWLRLFETTSLSTDCGGENELRFSHEIPSLYSNQSGSLHFFNVFGRFFNFSGLFLVYHHNKSIYIQNRVLELEKHVKIAEFLFSQDLNQALEPRDEKMA